MILTLKDQEVLSETGDLLVNVNMIDDERYKRSNLNKTKKPMYDPYDDENFDEFGFPKNKVLEKYDEEIDGEKRDNFLLGVNNPVELKRRQAETVKQRLANKKLESLQMAEPKLASEYYNEEELAKFKKPKKKVKNFFFIHACLQEINTLEIIQLVCSCIFLTCFMFITYS